MTIPGTLACSVMTGLVMAVCDRHLAAATAVPRAGVIVVTYVVGICLFVAY